MNNKEAIEILKKNKPTCDTRECGKKLCMAVDAAIEVLEKADKYRWHDLRKNPDDLPEDNGYGCSEYVLVMIGTPEWDNHEWAYYNHNTKMWSTPLCEQNVFAWRYIEPFEGEEDGI